MIEIKDCVMSFDRGENALDGISISVPEGSAYGLLGSNGAGKSTLLRLMTGIYKPAAGSVRVDGEDVYDNPRIKERVFLVGDETVQFTNMTLKQMRDYYKTFYATFSDELFEKLLGTVKLPRDKKLMTFSKGMKRQAAVICGLSCKTPYLLLDEAFDGLDPTMRNIVKQMMIDAMLDRKLTVIFSSHNMAEMDEFCDRVGLLHNGKVVFDRELDTIKGSIVKLQTAFDREVTKEDFADIELLSLETSGSVTKMIARGESSNIIESVRKFSPKFIDEMPLSLEEIFIYEMEVLGYDSSGLKD
ncbi:MAG: ABC transporter ATP-binding protein [Oscillospiraceae bacterium]|nr:ABC transporter ATP-binding protein [Oscillospiraceae bacterium]